MTSKSKRNALSAVFVQTVQKTGTYSDGGGLNLRVENPGPNTGFNGLPSTGSGGIWVSAGIRRFLWRRLARLPWSTPG